MNPATTYQQVAKSIGFWIKETNKPAVRITDVYQLRRDSGLLTFPCFRIDKLVNDGFSGGPVFWEDKLCGIVSTGSVDGSTYAASLWPLCLLEYEYPDLGTLGSRRVFGELFERGVVRSNDWRNIKDRIAKRYDAEGNPTPKCCRSTCKIITLHQATPSGFVQR